MTTPLELSLLPRVLALTAPVPGASPTGKDVSYDPDFEAVSAEIAKLTSLSGGAPAWGDIVSKGEDLLRTRSKDLRVAVWVTAARLNRSGWPGLVEGLLLVRALVADAWAGLYPPAARAKARANLAEWLWEHLTARVPSLPARGEDRAAVELVAALVFEIDGLLAGHLAAMNPGVSRLRTALEQKQRELPAVEKVEAPPAEKRVEAEATGASTTTTAAATTTTTSTPISTPISTPTPTATTLAPSPAPPIASPPASTLPPTALPPATLPETSTLDAVQTAARRWGQSLLELARHARRADRSSPFAYRLARWGAWIALDAAPPCSAGVKTYAAAPKPADRARITTLTANAQWEALLQASEEAFVQTVLWLDVQRYSALALERLGDIAARDALVRETLALLERVPSLPTLQFSNGTPFADAETVAWLDAQRERLSPAPSNASPAATNAATDEALARAKALGAEGKIDDAVAAALRVAASAPAPRERFVARLAAAKIAASGGRTAAARALTTELLAEIDATLEAWEPGLVADVLLTHLKLPEPTGAPPETPAKDVLLRRLLRLNPEAAMKLWP